MSGPGAPSRATCEAHVKNTTGLLHTALTTQPRLLHKFHDFPRAGKHSRCTRREPCKCLPWKCISVEDEYEDEYDLSKHLRYRTTKECQPKSPPGKPPPPIIGKESKTPVPITPPSKQQEEQIRLVHSIFLTHDCQLVQWPALKFIVPASEIKLVCIPSPGYRPSGKNPLSKLVLYSVAWCHPSPPLARAL